MTLFPDAKSFCSEYFGVKSFEMKDFGLHARVTLSFHKTGGEGVLGPVPTSRAEERIPPGCGRWNRALLQERETTGHPAIDHRHINFGRKKKKD